MKFVVQAPMKIDEGMHKGIIIGVDYRDKPYEYTDIIIEFEEGKKIKTGVPSFISPTSKLGELMTLFGAILEIGKEIEPEMLIGKVCQFMTINTNTKKGTFAVVVTGSLKPLVK